MVVGVVTEVDEVEVEAVAEEAEGEAHRCVGVHEEEETLKAGITRITTYMAPRLWQQLARHYVRAELEGFTARLCAGARSRTLRIRC